MGWASEICVFSGVCCFSLVLTQEGLLKQDRFGITYGRQSVFASQRVDGAEENSDMQSDKALWVIRWLGRMMRSLWVRHHSNYAARLRSLEFADWLQKQHGAIAKAPIVCYSPGFYHFTCPDFALKVTLYTRGYPKPSENPQNNIGFSKI